MSEIGSPETLRIGSAQDDGEPEGIELAATYFEGGPGRHCPGVRAWSEVGFSERSRR